jgi:16S rRNA (guanine527-N7)-methyltransferase
MTVSRETVADVVLSFGVPEADQVAGRLHKLLMALAEEPDPPTTVREPAAALDVHVADSLSGLAVPALRSATRIADIGAGAGFPGLVLAAALPGSHVDLIESSRRKCDVIERLALAAGISDRARAVPARAEEWASGEGSRAYGAVTSRALAPLAVICEYAAPLLAPSGVAVAWKGARDPDEEAAAAVAAAQVGLAAVEIRAVAPFPASRTRHLYVYSKVRETPSQFPRRVGVAAKKPLA